MTFNYDDLTKKEKKQYDSLDAESKKLYEKQWVKMKQEMNKLNATIQRAKEKERKQRTHRLIQISGAVESVLGSPIEGEEEIRKFMLWLKENNVKNFRK